MKRPSLRSDKLAWLVAGVLLLNACGGGSSSHGGGSAPAPTPTEVRIAPTAAPSPGASPTSSPDPAAFVCPTSDSASSVAARTASSTGQRRFPARSRARAATTRLGTTQLLAVTMSAQTAAAQRTALATRESSLGATLVRQYQFTHTNVYMHVIRVPASAVTTTEAALRAQPGVRSVALTGARRFAAGVTAPYYPSDPYFQGFQTTLAPSTGATAPPPTFETENGTIPLSESSGVPGQWDMHAIRLEYAFGYSQTGNTIGARPAALGSSSVKLAIIDTGEDTTHPELHSKIAYQKCFITNESGTQSTSNYTTDPDGHGTDVTGIAGAATGNGLGFTAAGGNVAIYGYRVFPTPDDNCTSDTSTDVQCGADTNDIASAIDDAVAQKVNVISMSLGGGSCGGSGSYSNGDPDPVEGAAVAEAISANIVVVAAAGNSTGPPVEAPGCDTGVIAVGATGISDGTANGSGNTTGTATSPTEYVASYTDYGSPGKNVNSSSAWGIVAPGGDPATAESNPNATVDNLHWIQNIWTTTPYMLNAQDTSFEGDCIPDYPNSSGTTDCQVLIAGTSMATPHVAGAAALIISVNSSYQSPTLMKELLCQTADDISDANEGCGRLDVYRAMASALSDPSPPTSGYPAIP